MRIDVHHHLHIGSRHEFEELKALILQLTERTTTMAQELDDLTREVGETSTVVDSAITLLDGIKTRLDEAIAANNPQALRDLSASLDSKQQELAAAVARNTPAE